MSPETPQLSGEELERTISKGKQRLLTLAESSKVISERKIAPKRKKSQKISYQILESPDGLPFCVFFDPRGELLMENDIVNPYNSVYLIGGRGSVRGLVEDIFVYFATKHSEVSKAVRIPFFGLSLYPTSPSKSPGSRKAVEICNPLWTTIFTITTSGQLQFDLTAASRRGPFATYSWMRNSSGVAISESLTLEPTLYHPKVTYEPGEDGSFRITSDCVREDLVSSFPKQDLLKMFDISDPECTDFLLIKRAKSHG